MDVIFCKITFKETTLKVLNIVDAASGMHIATQMADRTAETIWRAFVTGWLRWAGSPRCLRVDPHWSQIARSSSTKQKDEAYWWNQHRLKHTGRWDRWKTIPYVCDKLDTDIVEDIDVSQGDFQTMLDELTDAKNTLGTTQWIHAKTVGVRSDFQGARSHA